ncbi:hypothetical protein Goshw_018371, partial [Gossypium schwendimanii]|nr:hypothetical protein [Gossypium schwendimanii]
MGVGGVFWPLDDGGATKKGRLIHRRGECAKGKGLMVRTRPRYGPSALRPNNGRFGVKPNKGKPPDEVAGNQLHDSAELKLAMEGLDCDLERNPDKALMKDDSQYVKKVMVIEDTCSNE